MSKARYKTGKQIRSMQEFDACESLWYKWNGSTRFRSVLESLQYRVLSNLIADGRIYTAELIDDAENETSEGEE